MNLFTITTTSNTVIALLLQYMHG